MGNSTSEIITKEQFGQTVHLWEKNSLVSNIFDGYGSNFRVHFYADTLIIIMQWSSACN